MNKLVNEDIHRKNKNFSVNLIFINGKHEQITLKNDVANCMDRRFVGQRSLKKIQREKDTHSCSWQEVYRANRVNIPYSDNMGVVL